MFAYKWNGSGGAQSKTWEVWSVNVRNNGMPSRAFRASVIPSVGVLWVTTVRVTTLTYLAMRR